MSARGIPKLTLGFALFVALVSLGTCCTEDEWKCKSNECINGDALCDGIKDCPDGSDETEETCSNMECPAFAFRCDYGACINSHHRCDGNADCVDKSDEKMCNSKP